MNPPNATDWQTVQVVARALPSWLDGLFPHGREFIAWLAVRAVRADETPNGAAR